MGPRRQFIGDLPRHVVANPQFVFVDQGVVNPVDLHPAERVVIHARLEPLGGDVMLEPQPLEEILIDDIGAVLTIASTIRLRTISTKIFLSPALTSEPARQRMIAALAVAEHPVVDVGGPMQIAGAIGHVLHGVDERHDVVLRKFDVQDRLREEFVLGGHDLRIQI